MGVLAALFSQSVSAVLVISPPDLVEEGQGLCTDLR